LTPLQNQTKSLKVPACLQDLLASKHKDKVGKSGDKTHERKLGNKCLHFSVTKQKWKCWC